MFTSVDKMFTSGIATGVSYLVASGALTAEQGVSLEGVLMSLAAFVVGAIVTYIVPNKS